MNQHDQTTSQSDLSTARKAAGNACAPAPRTTAQVLVECLKAEGVEVVFGIPGE